MDNTSGKEQKPGVSKLKLAIGAASLFLFIVGLKRTFTVDEAQDGTRATEDRGDRPAWAERSGSPRG